MKKGLIFALLITLSLPAHAAWLATAQSLWHWFCKNPEAQHYRVATVVAGSAAVGLAALNLYQKKRMVAAGEKLTNAQDAFQNAIDRSDLELLNKRFKDLESTKIDLRTMLNLVNQSQPIVPDNFVGMYAPIVNKLNDLIIGYNACSTSLEPTRRSTDTNFSTHQAALKAKLTKFIELIEALEEVEPELMDSLYSGHYGQYRAFLRESAYFCAGFALLYPILGAIQHSKRL